MKQKLLALSLLAAASALHAAPWTYKGTLNDGGKPANGVYDLRVTLLNEAKSASLTNPITLYAVPVENGHFAVDVDFQMDFAAAPTMALKTEVQQGNSGFVSIGEPSRFDPKAALVSVCWETSGNAGTVGGTDFLGTSDAQPLEIGLNSRRVMLLQPSTELGTNGRHLTANVTLGSVGNGVIAPARGATISGGGAQNNTDPLYTTGGSNRVDDHYGTVAGGFNNQAGSIDSDPVTGAFATVSGGRNNTASGANSIVSGGLNNVVSGSSGTIAGGANNTVSGSGGTIAGGTTNTAGGGLSTVSGGIQNTASGLLSSVVGGSNNQATGARSTVGSGSSNCAGGDDSWVGGQNAKTRVGNGAGDGTCAPSSGDANGDEGSFVWADQSSATDFVTNRANQFLVRADGGVGININDTSTNDDVVIAPRSTDPDANLVLQSTTSRSANFVMQASTGTLRIQMFPPAAGQNRIDVFGGGTASLSNGGTWTNASSRSYKENFGAVNGLDVLSRLVKLPIMTWDYKGSSEGQHMGPVAEDFKASFGLAGDGKSISTVDADGIALAAIQGLNAKLETENAALRARLDALEARAK
jgi:trimeric autotransporter adhesin